MAVSPENFPRQESVVEAEKPRTGAVILTTRTYLGKLLNDSLHTRIMDVPTSIRRKQSKNSKKENVSIRYLLEYGREEALKYAMQNSTTIESQLNFKKKIKTDDYLKNDNKDIPIKTYQEITKARIIVSRCLDIATMGVYLRRDRDKSATLYHGGIHPSIMNEKDGIQSLEDFARVAGFYQGLSYLLGMENDGGMADFINQSDVNDFKIPAHP